MKPDKALVIEHENGAQLFEMYGHDCCTITEFDKNKKRILESSQSGGYTSFKVFFPNGHDYHQISQICGDDYLMEEYDFKSGKKAKQSLYYYDNLSAEVWIKGEDPCVFSCPTGGEKITITPHENGTKTVSRFRFGPAFPNMFDSPLDQDILKPKGYWPQAKLFENKDEFHAALKKAHQQLNETLKMVPVETKTVSMDQPILPQNEYYDHGALHACILDCSWISITHTLMTQTILSNITKGDYSHTNFVRSPYNPLQDLRKGDRNEAIKIISSRGYFKQKILPAPNERCY